MKITIHFLVVFLGIIFQLLFRKWLQIEGIAPDFLVIALVWIAFNEGRFHGTISGFLLGLLQDIFEISFLGLAVLAKSIAGFIAGLLFRAAPTGRRRWILIALAVASLVHDTIYFSVFNIGSNIVWWRIVFIEVLPSSLYTLVAGFISYSLIPQKFWR